MAWRSEPFTRVVAPESVGVSIVPPDSSASIYGWIHAGWKAPDSIKFVDQLATGSSIGSWEVSWKGASGGPTITREFYSKTDSVAIFPYDSAGGCVAVRQHSMLGYSKPVTTCQYIVQN